MERQLNFMKDAVRRPTVSNSNPDAPSDYGIEVNDCSALMTNSVTP